MIGLAITPFILQISKEYEDYSGNKQISDPKSMTLTDFMGAYFSEGFSCLLGTEIEDKHCDYSYIYLLGYVFALFIL